MKNCLKDTVDNHIHCCPHINKRSTNIFEVVKHAENAGMHAIGLMDNFCNTSGYASLIKKYNPNLKLKVFGGLIMEPPAGGINLSNAKIAVNYGYEDSEGGKFISFPTHHTRFVALQENRPKSYIDTCFFVNKNKAPDDETLKILDLIAEKNIVLNTGHISGIENFNLVTYAKKAGVKKILIPANNLKYEDINLLKNLGAYFEFSYFFTSKATEIPLTHIDNEKHTISKLEVDSMKNFIRSIGPEQVILSSDCGVSVLPKPHQGLLNFISIIKGLGFSSTEMKKMTSSNSKELFNV